MNAPAATSGEPCAAVLLAGGQSRRMGRDKALLALPGGRLLWQRQLDVLRELAPAELFLSGFARPGFPADVPLLADELPGCGPLGGIAAALAAMASPRLVVLAIDLPHMTAAFLRGLLAECGAGQGVVPRAADGFFEPLAAVYPRTAHAEARARLGRGEYALQPFVRTLTAEGKASARRIRQEETVLFTNWNVPEDPVN